MAYSEIRVIKIKKLWKKGRIASSCFAGLAMTAMREKIINMGILKQERNYIKQ
jgi:hypothetical protein